MSAFQHLHRQNGFPFSPSVIAAGRPVSASGVNAPVMPDPERRGLVTAFQPELPQGYRAVHRDGFRLLPLEAFAWGSRTNPPKPGTRPDHVLIWVVEGQALLSFAYGDKRLRAGELRYIPAGTAFAAMPDTGVRGHVALIAARLADAAMPPLPRRTMTLRVGPHDDKIRATLHELALETSRANPRTLSCLINLLSLRLGLLSPGNAPGCAARTRPDRPLVDRFLDLARQRLGGAQTVAELAAELDGSVALLDQACLAAHGKRAIELIHDLQVECAARLLRDTAQPTHRIAADLGYSSHAHFVRAFAAATGRRPDVFRAQSG